MDQVSVRYFVDDVDEAKAFYSSLLGFTVDLAPAPGFAMLSKGNLRLLLNEPGKGGAGNAKRDGKAPEPGGFNRFQISINDLAAKVNDLREEGASFAGELVEGQGGKQILLEDPSGNLIELFESTR